MLTGLAWALREMKGPAAAPAAPAAASFRKSRRVAFDREGSAMDIPPISEVVGIATCGDDTAPGIGASSRAEAAGDLGQKIDLAALADGLEERVLVDLAVDGHG